MDQRRTGNSGYDVKHVTDRHMEVARRIALGDNPADIARSLGVTRQTVSNIRNHPVIQEIIRALHNRRDQNTSDITQQIARIAPKALRLLENTIDIANINPDNEQEILPATPPDVSDQIRAALGIIKTVAPRMNLHRHIVTGDMIDRIKRRALEGRDAGEEDAIIVEEQ